MSNLFIFILSSFALLVTPGPDTVLITKNIINFGKRIGMYTAFGTMSGALVHIILVTFGISTLIYSSPFLFNTVKLVGILYLLALGIITLYSAIKVNECTNNQKEIPIQNAKNAFIQAFLTNVLNPKVLIFFLTFFPQFINSKGNSILQLIQLDIIFLSVGIVWIAIYINLINIISHYFQNIRIQRSINFITGIIFVGFSIQLLFNT